VCLAVFIRIWSSAWISVPARYSRPSASVGLIAAARAAGRNAASKAVVVTTSAPTARSHGGGSAASRKTLPKTRVIASAPRRRVRAPRCGDVAELALRTTRCHIERRALRDELVDALGELRLDLVRQIAI
jgi:phage tail tape-measure protein